MTIQVPNEFPTESDGIHRLGVIGEAPGHDETIAQRPFVGKSGRFLTALLAKHGLARSQVFIGSVAQYQPPNNDIFKFTWDGPEIKAGREQLARDLEVFKPNCLLLLGNVALKAFKDPESIHPLIPKAYRFKNANWRGSVFQALGYKCLPSYHPAYCLRDYTATPLLSFDIKKAIAQSATPDLKLLERMKVIPDTFLEAKALLEGLIHDKPKIGTDIEGGVYGMSSISFSPSPHYGFTIPFIRNNSKHYWTMEEEIELLILVARVLEDPGIEKVLQAGLYDTFVLHYAYLIRIRNVTDDTMLKGWEKYSELEKGLGMLCSLYTDQPFYKGDRKSTDDKTFYEYNALDSIITKEVDEVLETALTPRQLEHYHFNVNMQLPLRYMEVNGIRYDTVKAKERCSFIRAKMFEAKAQLNAMTGHGFSWESIQEIKDHAQALFYQKKDRTKPYAKYEVATIRLEALLNKPSPDLATIGEVESLCEVGLNTESPEVLMEYLYETLGLPLQLHKITERPTSNYEALLNLSKYCQKSEQPDKLAIINKLIEISALTTRQEMLSIYADPDGRIRCGYNVVGSDTGRIQCYMSPTGSGYNLQTIPNYTKESEAPAGVLGDRDLFIADEGYWMFACDLEGADSWTVAAYCAMLGDSTMLNDLRYGLRPAKILTLMVRGMRGDYSNRDWLMQASKQVNKEDLDAFACKGVVHGASYCEGPLTISRNLFEKSEGRCYYTQSECATFRSFFLQRYWGIPKWHAWAGRQIAYRPELECASGFKRIFFERQDQLLPTVVANEPQHNTTYAINKATWNLWVDPENRTSEEGRGLIIQPLHTIHDELVGQFPKADTDWAIAKIKTYFANTIKIAGQDIVIPFEGGYGESWAAAKAKKVGIIK